MTIKVYRVSQTEYMYHYERMHYLFTLPHTFELYIGGMTTLNKTLNLPRQYFIDVAEQELQELFLHELKKAEYL